jgi:hypothetical protein
MKKTVLHVNVMLAFLLSALIGRAQKPTITNFSPKSGPVGTIVTLTGTGFNATPANNIVHFGAVKANVTASGTGSLTVIVPAGASYQYIHVLNSTSQLSGYSLFPFTTTFNGCAPLNVNTFGPRTNFAGDVFTRSVVFADFDRDGRADMVATNTQSTNISIFRNTSLTGSVSFASKIELVSGSTGAFAGASGLATGDLDGDGKLDIVVSNHNAMDVSVFINTTIGSSISFAPKVEFPVQDKTLGVAIADLDGDGKPDIAIANSLPATASVSLLRNTSVVGVPSFITQNMTTGLVSPRELALGDMDGDGKPDLVVSDELGNNVLAYRNNSTTGTISFQAPLITASGTWPRGISLGDLDGDGKLDVAVSNTQSSSISVFRNTSVSGTISLTPKIDFPTGISPREVAIADIDGDGLPDMAASSNSVTVPALCGLKNISVPGTISFKSFVSFPTENNALSVCLQDVDNDGKTDVAVTSTSINTVSVFLNNSPLSTLSTIAPATITSTTVCDNSTWQTVYDPGTNGVIASIKYNGNNLGTITATAYVRSSPGMVSSGHYYLARHFVVKPSVQPLTPVQVRLYITDVELQALRVVDPSIITADELSITRYTGPNEDGIFDITTGFTDIIPSTSITTGFDYTGHYLEFTTSSFSEFWIHSGLHILPVDITNFTALQKINKIFLNWTIAGAENPDRFVVERSGDGINYNAIGTVMAAGNALPSNSYFYTDQHPLTGANFYRLQVSDIKGNKKQSKVVMVNRQDYSQASVTVSYLSSRQVRATLNGNNTNGRFLVFDASGRKLLTYTVNGGVVGSKLDIDLGQFGPGVYFYQLITDKGILSNGKLLLK